MSRSIPYQPLLLRILHGIAGVLALGAIATGFWVYNNYDGRFGRLLLPKIIDMQGIHGTFGLFFLLIFPALALYSFHAGARRLIQADFLQQVTRQVGQPLWWVTVQRITNTAMLVAATFSVVTGRMMKEAWLPAGELHHIWYSLHLLGWLILVLGLALHLLMSAKVGGAPLLRSMWSVTYREADSPAHWVSRFRQWMRHLKQEQPK